MVDEAKEHGPRHGVRRDERSALHALGLLIAFGGCAGPHERAPNVAEAAPRVSTLAPAASLPPAAASPLPPGASPPTPGLRTVAKLADALELIRQLPSTTTLVVLDIDDTLLTSPTYFGSDAWYNWQEGLRSSDPQSAERAPCLFGWVALNYEVGTQVATEPGGAGLVAQIAPDRLILTSRSPTARGATERELDRAGYTSRPTIGPDQEYTWHDAEKNRDHPASYRNGIFMTQGANKGSILLDLLKRLGREGRYRHVVLVDDGPKNIENMRQALAAARQGMTYYGLLYTQVKKSALPTVDELRAARDGLREWTRLLDTVYPERKARLFGSPERCDR
jgi:uncharacterized protein DUF2608